MLDLSSRPQVEPAADTATGRDTLTALLLGLRLDGVEYGRCVLHAPWAAAFAPRAAASFHFAARGGAWLRMSDAGDWMRLDQGDAVLLPHGGAHVLASDPSVPPVDVAAFSRVPVADNLYLMRDAAGGGQDAADVMFCGAMRFNLDPLHPLMAMMPAVIHAGELARRDPAVPALLEAMEREVALDRIGACGILARLADVLAASIIRGWVECDCSDPTGWIAAVRCPKIGKVIAAIHADPQRDWTVPALAGIMGASRSRFAEAFTRTVGDTPGKYVAKVKMFRARQWITEEGMRVAVAADRLGYDSEVAFSRAFKRIVGQPPSALRPLRYQARRAA
ncbi:AraC family transcriptional regulator [Xylophilus sp.]|uniref:AraC family transcriptional regulator n=1 Tax=Xylophilus sp. TaxID=2653893 RepID=UPI0013BBD615|nr:AraC family transcriptional regulator [Xylophilus sp.]KAF1050068.1 MAG: RCS-specific HTH-type transcriptional activator RclR [Xylophilus sp.]